MAKSSFPRRSLIGLRLSYPMSNTSPALYRTASPSCPFPFVGLPPTASHGVWISLPFPKFLNKYSLVCLSFPHLQHVSESVHFHFSSRKSGNECMSSQSGLQGFRYVPYSYTNFGFLFSLEMCSLLSLVALLVTLRSGKLCWSGSFTLAVPGFIHRYVLRARICNPMARDSVAGNLLYGWPTLVISC